MLNTVNLENEIMAAKSQIEVYHILLKKNTLDDNILEDLHSGHQIVYLTKINKFVYNINWKPTRHILSLDEIKNAVLNDIVTI